MAVEGALAAPATCDWMRADRERAGLCARVVQDGAGKVGTVSTCGATCVAGLREAAIPLRLGGEIFGYLLVGQVATRPLDKGDLNRWRHALERIGQRVSTEELEALAAKTTILDETRYASVIRLLEESAVWIAMQMEDHMTKPVEALTPQIRKACSFIRSRFDEPLTLGAVAAEVGMSREHFCSVFHKNTGLRFVEYLTRIRVEEAATLLRGSDRSIAEIALACGFQSISHFNRRFRSVTGRTPSEHRRQAR